MKTDTVAQKKAPALVSRFGLPGRIDTGLRIAMVVELYQRLGNYAG